MKEWLVSDKTCKGCKYYGFMTPGNRGVRCCDYTFITGRIRRNKPAACEVKVLRKGLKTMEMRTQSIPTYSPKKKGGAKGG